MYYTQQRIERICKDLQKLICQPRQPITAISWSKGRYTSPAEADQAEWQVFNPGDHWGEYDDHAWFRADVTITPQFDGKKVLLDVSVDTERWFADSRQFILFVDGTIRQGMDINHRTCVLRHQARAGEMIRVDLEAYAGLVEKPTELYLQLFVENPDVKKIYYDLFVPLQVYEMPDGTSCGSIAGCADPGCQPARSAQTVQRCLPPVFADTSLSRNAFYQAFCGAADQAVAVGHPHHRCRWLWAAPDAVEKTGRSFATCWRLMVGLSRIPSCLPSPALPVPQ